MNGPHAETHAIANKKVSIRLNFDITKVPCNSVATPVLYLGPAVRQVDFEADEMSNASDPLRLIEFLLLIAGKT